MRQRIKKSGVKPSAFRLLLRKGGGGGGGGGGGVFVWLGGGGGGGGASYVFGRRLTKGGEA